LRYRQVVTVLAGRCIHCSCTLLYREDYIKLGIKENATIEEIKSAYFRRAKELHPDSREGRADDDSGEAPEFVEITEAYKRLLYESKIGTNSFTSNDPRNDPRKSEYWEIRKRKRSPEDIKVEEEVLRQRQARERSVLYKALFGLAIGVFFGTIFPALFVGDGEYKEMCNCEKCLLKRIRSNPSTMYMLQKQSNSSQFKKPDPIPAS